MPPPKHQVTTSYPPTKIRFGHSILFKQLALYLLLILVISATIGYFFFATAHVSLETEIGKKLQYIARISAGDVPVERLELIEEGDDQTRMVLRLKEKLGQIQQATGVLNIYVFRPDMRSLLDLNPDMRIGTSYTLEHLTPELMDKLSRGESVHTSSVNKSVETGFLISAYSPLHDLDGRLFAVIGVDGGQELALIRQRMSTRFYWIAGLGGVLAAALALVFARSITRPIRQIAQTAEHLGQGDYTARAQVMSRDEVGVLAQSVNRMAEQVRQRDTALKEMGASVAHEIRNPLNSIKLLVSLLDEEMEDRKTKVQESTIETLDYEIGKLNRYIGEFLTYARPQADERVVVSAGELLAGMQEMAAAEAQSRQVRIQVQEDRDLPLLQVNRMRLEQTLLNLLLNAVQACSAGGRVGVHVCRAEAEKGIEFRIEDSGVGIAPEAMPHLFEPFFTTKAEGTGLGLANARKIAEEHRGHLRAENKPEGGACFVLFLPGECIAEEKV